MSNLRENQSVKEKQIVENTKNVPNVNEKKQKEFISKTYKNIISDLKTDTKSNVLECNIMDLKQSSGILDDLGENKNEEEKNKKHNTLAVHKKRRAKKKLILMLV